VYYIWYGNWTGNTATTILADLARNIGGSPYFSINTSYYDTTKKHVLNAVNFAGSTTDNYSQGKSLTGAQVQTIVNSALTTPFEGIMHPIPTPAAPQEASTKTGEF